MPFYNYKTIAAAEDKAGQLAIDDASYQLSAACNVKGVRFVKLEKAGQMSWWKNDVKDGSIELKEMQWITKKPDGAVIVNGQKDGSLRPVGNLVAIEGQNGNEVKTGRISPFGLLSKMAQKDTIVKRWKKVSFKDGADEITGFYPMLTGGDEIMVPGQKFKVASGSFMDKLDFASLMLALFFGTAALPHILIRYYTVPSPACARKSTIVAIAAIGLFYILTLFMGLGAMTNGVINPLDGNMSAPLLAKSFGTLLFAIISAVAFATVLGTVSGLIVAASGAVAHDIVDRFANLKMTDNQKVWVGKAAAVSVGIIAIVLGIIFKGMNVSFLVGWAFAVAASANLPAIIMLLFWKRTTSKGIAASIVVGIITSLGIILLSPSMYDRYGLDPQSAPMPFSNPGIISIPLSFITLVAVSLITKAKNQTEAVAVQND